MHEVVAVFVLVKILVRPPLDIYHIDFRTGRESVLEYAAVFKIAELGFHECRALARFYMLEPYDRTWFSVVIKIKSVFKISCSCHKIFLFLLKLQNYKYFRI